MKILFSQFARILALVLAMGAAFLFAPLAFADSCEEAFNRFNYNTAYRLCLPLAKQGDASAQFRLGWMYDEGKGIPVGDTESARWWRKAAEQGYAPAQYMLGSSYMMGEDTPENHVHAYKWLNLAAAQGEEHATPTLFILELLMTEQQIAEGQRLVSEFHEARQ